MKKTYMNPDIRLEIFSAEEILTDVIKASRPVNNGDVQRIDWSTFIG